MDFGEVRRLKAAQVLRNQILITMELIINGKAAEFSSPLTLAALIDRLGMKADRVAVELNRAIVPRDRWAETNLADGDRLEIVHFVGGGSLN